ncbi:hypothetical protein [Persicobacter psychrovividus]|uniref:Uncharacterized protein n=1 Tax=Persicobacter psychrovividus TaxID=387638 RepID=A0ABN6LJ38_9BACT|nr:hypothetical protein PEPS_42130 [Persicobacter psychrovividus]
MKSSLYQYINKLAASATSEEEVFGLLFSQIGYHPDRPIKVILRLPETHAFEEGSCHLISEQSDAVYDQNWIKWGNVWGAQWWIATFEGVAEGHYHVEHRVGAEVMIRDGRCTVKKDILWDDTYNYCSVDMLQRRFHFTGLQMGWQDAGTKWAESPAQSSMLMGLLNMYLNGSELYDEEFKKALAEQIIVGADYMVATADYAAEKGYAEGSFVHDLLENKEVVLPNDASKAVLSLIQTYQALPDYAEKKNLKSYILKGWEYLRSTTSPQFGFSTVQRGIDADILPPEGEWPTRELFNFVAIIVEGDKNKLISKQGVSTYLKQLRDRQLKAENAVQGIYGVFKEFDSTDHLESMWVHSILDHVYGVDSGGLIPPRILDLLQIVNGDFSEEDKQLAEEIIHDFAYGFLIPAARQNPFSLLPNTVKLNGDCVWFAGPFHGMNSIYGYLAETCFALSKHYREEEFEQIAYGNLQWIAGLNSGLTQEAQDVGCVVCSANQPRNTAIPVGMICGIGNRTFGTWFQSRGVITSGFSVGAPFVLDVMATKENDRPQSFTDEEWIPHSAGWLHGAMKLKQLSNS